MKPKQVKTLPQATLRPLDDILQYENDRVIRSFMGYFDIDEQTSRLIFKDLLRFLWLCHAGSPGQHEVKNIDNSQLIIDEMWHVFILHTKDYLKFCLDYFGVFSHHAPTDELEKNTMSGKSKQEDFKRDFVERKRKKYSDIYDLLGEEVFHRWFMEYPDRFTPETVLALRKR